MGTYSANPDVLIASAECQTESGAEGTGSPLCEQIGLEGFPTLMYGSPGNWSQYYGSRQFADLNNFVKGKIGLGAPGSVAALRGTGKVQGDGEGKCLDLKGQPRQKP
jgi:hypothetical protein